MFDLGTEAWQRTLRCQQAHAQDTASIGKRTAAGTVHGEHGITAARAFPVASAGSTLGPQPSVLVLVACEHATQLKSAGCGGADW